MPKIESADRATEIVVIFFNAFKDANGLHSNFYEAGFSTDFSTDFSMDIVEEFAERIR